MKIINNCEELRIFDFWDQYDDLWNLFPRWR